MASNLQPSDLRSNAYRSLPGGQDVSPCYFHVIISIGILESNSLSLSTPSRTKWTLVYICFTALVKVCRTPDNIFNIPMDLPLHGE